MQRIEREVSGGCQCGAVRYHASAMLDNSHLCHCRMCQKASGNVFAALVAAPDDALTWTRGKPSLWKSSELVERGFCANCGTPLFFHHLENGRTNLMIGSLDDPNAFPPLANTCTENMVAWFDTITGKKKNPVRPRPTAPTGPRRSRRATTSTPITIPPHGRRGGVTAETCAVVRWRHLRSGGMKHRNGAGIIEHGGCATAIRIGAPPADLPGKSARLGNRRTHRSLRHGEGVRPEGRACFRQDQRRPARTYLEVCPPPIASALTKTCSGRMLQANPEKL